MAKSKNANGEEKIFYQGQYWTREKLAEYREYQKAFMKEKYQSFVFRCNKESEAEIIEHIKAQENIAGYIKGLIADDIAGKKPPVAHSAFVADEIMKLVDLQQKEIITKEEFDTLKARLVNLGAEKRKK